VIDVGVPINQNALPPEMILGHGPKRAQKCGCFVASWTMAARPLLNHKGLTFFEAHDKIMKADGFSGSGLRRTRAAKALGLELLDPDGSEPFDLAIARAELTLRRPVIVGIDYREGASSGFSNADHFMVIQGYADGLLRMVDPNGGRQFNIKSPQAFRYGKNEAARIVEMCRLRAAPL
jgi:hypothetical protein